MVDMPTTIAPEPESFDGLAVGAASNAAAATVATATTVKPWTSWGSGASVFRPESGE
jgi:hypothetical protein